MARQQRGDVELGRAVEAGVALRHVLAQQPTGADHARTAEPVRRRMIDHQQVIAQRIVGIDVAPRQECGGMRDSRHLLVEHVEAQPLGAAHVGGAARQPHLERAEPSQHVRGVRHIIVTHAQAAIGAQRRRERRPQLFEPSTRAGRDHPIGSPACAKPRYESHGDRARDSIMSPA
jgi:hypothetical protein